MPRYEITGPDGKYEVNAPDGASEADIAGFAQKHFAQLAADRKDMERMADPSAGMSGPEKALVGAGKFFSDTGTAAKQIAASVGLGDKEALNTEVKESRKRDAPLMKSWWAKAGNFAPALATAFIPGANTVGGATAVGAGLGALQPIADDESRLANTVVGGVAGAAGQAVGEELGAAVTSRLAQRAAERAAAKAANAPRDAVLEAGQAAGYVVPPTQAKPSALNTVLEAASGKVATEKAASAQNQAVTNKLTALGLKLPHDEPITPAALKAVREEAGKAYEKIAAGKFVADDSYKKGLEGLAVSHRNLAEQIPELANKDVLALTKSLQKDEFDGRTLVEALKALRERATIAFHAGETQAGRFYKGASREIEDLIERNLLYTGSGGKKTVQELRAARQMIAKSHAAEAALNPATGNIDAKKFADAVRRGKPISDEMRTVGEFASTFPKATQLPERMGTKPGLSVADMGVAALRGDAGGLAWLTGRPAARALILSKVFQNAAAKPDYSAPIAQRIAHESVKDGRLAAAMRAALPPYVTERN